MADLTPQTIDLSTINGGKRFENGDGIPANAVNAPLQSSAYVQYLLETILPEDVIANQNSIGKFYQAFGDICFYDDSPIYASITYQRTGVGIGRLVIDFQISAEYDYGDRFYIISKQKIIDLLTPKNVTVSFEDAKGICVPIPLSAEIVSHFGYAMAIVSKSSASHLEIGRYYTAGGTFGGLSMNNLRGIGYHTEISVKEV